MGKRPFPQKLYQIKVGCIMVAKREIEKTQIYQEFGETAFSPKTLSN
nr:MAG TPA: hypothetical protein [Inoviridae sp.]